MKSAVVGILVLALLPSCGRDTDSPSPADSKKSTEASQPLSLLLVVVDTLRADHLGVYGYELPTSPVLDEFAQKATVYEEAITPAPFTMPAMAALFTGLYPDRTGVINHEPRNTLNLAKADTLAELAQRAGYRTHAVVTNSWLTNKKMGFRRGFDVYKGKLVDATRVTHKAMQRLEEIGDDPFLLWVHYIDTHMPYQPPKKFAELFGNSSTTSQVIKDFKSGERRKDEIYFAGDYPPEELEATRQLYDASIRYVDTHIGVLFDALERSGRRDDTIVVVVSDHGESLGEHGLYFAHDFALYEELTRVPLMISIPGQPPARVTGEVSLVDLVPSLCIWLEISCEEVMDGTPLPLDGRAESGRAVFAASAPFRDRYASSPRLYLHGVDGRWTMLRRGGKKLIRIPHPDAAIWELYDVRNDAREAKNLVDHEAPRALRDTLLKWEESMRQARPAAAEDPGQLDPETLEELRALGYTR